jgi:hypothetical protein
VIERGNRIAVQQLENTPETECPEWRGSIWILVGIKEIQLLKSV